MTTPTTGTSDRFIGPSALATRWNVSPKHVRKLIRLHCLRAIRVGRVLRISLAEVERYEREQAQGD